ncbi:MAG: tetratricopeptide repeat protein, partial [Pseudomonadota bacterium]
MNDDIENYLTHLAAQGWWEQLKINAQSVIDQHPEIATGWVFMGLVKITQERFDEALIDLKKACYLAPENSMAIINLIHCLIKQQQPLQAFTYGAKAIERFDLQKKEIPSNLLWSVSVAAKRSGALDDALKFLLRLSHDDPLNQPALKMLGQIYYQKRQYENALIYYQKLHTLKPDHIGHLGNLGTIYMQLWQLDQANLIFERVLSIDPHHITTINSMAALRTKQGRFEEALGFINHAEKLASQNLQTTSGIPQHNRALIL